MKFFKVFGLLTIVVFSFLYTEKIAEFTLEKNPLYQAIDLKKDSYNVMSVNAVIDSSYITPGLNGKMVNVKKSYYNMKDFNEFNDKYILYKSIKPDISLDDNKDKIINKGNPLKRSVSFIVEYDPRMINVFKNKDIDISILVDNNTYNKLEKNEQINNEFKEYDNLELLLNKDKKNTNICYLNKLNEDTCRYNNKYLIESKKIVNNSTVINIKNNIESGDIYYVSKNTSESSIDIIVNSINYRDLNIVKLSTLINEERD